MGFTLSFEGLFSVFKIQPILRLDFESEKIAL